ncbi:unnamed protein product [Spirodela intermedia]|uniref:Uncharacterized protein n=1 Tax=Spirodela intermedia TaxID=51605 RepID=A0A7I8IKV4_SPIIN|nr:unnamed protein product [Spirodela intermedia]CAA6658510.1 unnamed protein product [Spirodela intermedia]
MSRVWSGFCHPRAPSAATEPTPSPRTTATPRPPPPAPRGRSPSPAPPPAPPRTPPWPAVVSTKFSDVLAFGGPAPERINGRLAMVGFVAALGVELARGTGLAAQVAEGAGLPWFVATASVLSLASLVPLFKGVTPESRSAGLMTSDAEMWNGRFAMLGLVALAFTEFVTGGPLV